MARNTLSPSIELAEKAAELKVLSQKAVASLGEAANSIVFLRFGAPAATDLYTPRSFVKVYTSLAPGDHDQTLASIETPHPERFFVRRLFQAAGPVLNLIMREEALTVEAPALTTPSPDDPLIVTKSLSRPDSYSRRTVVELGSNTLMAAYGLSTKPKTTPLANLPPETHVSHMQAAHHTIDAALGILRQRVA